MSQKLPGEGQPQRATNWRLILGVIVLTAIFGSLGFLVLSPHEPVYEHKTYTEWLRRFEFPSAISKPGAEAAARDEARKAIQQIGTNAVPRLLEMVRARDLPFKRPMHTWLLDRHITIWQPKYAWDYHALASMGFTLLGPEARPAIPSLVTLLDDKDAGVRRAAVECLGMLPDGGKVVMQNVVPALVKRLNDPDELMQFAATEALGNLRANPAIVVPTLVGKLERKTMGPKNVYVTIKALGNYGTNAIVAVPLLQSYLSGSDSVLRSQAQLALDAITNRSADPVVK